MTIASSWSHICISDNNPHFYPPPKKKNRHAGQVRPAVPGRGDSLRGTEQGRELSWFWFLKLKRVELRRCSSHPPLRGQPCPLSPAGMAPLSPARAAVHAGDLSPAHDLTGSKWKSIQSTTALQAEPCSRDFFHPEELCVPCHVRCHLKQ